MKKIDGDDLLESFYKQIEEYDGEMTKEVYNSLLTAGMIIQKLVADAEEIKDEESKTYSPSEKLPEMGIDVIIKIHNGKVNRSYLDSNGKFKTYNRAYTHYEMENVIWWMPIPE